MRGRQRGTLNPRLREKDTLMKNTLKLFGALSAIAVVFATGCSSKPTAEESAPVVESAPVDMSGSSTDTADLGASSSGQGH